MEVATQVGRHQKGATVPDQTANAGCMVKAGYHSSDAWWTTPANQRIQVRPAVVGTLPPGRGRIKGIVPTQYAGVITSEASGSWVCGAFESTGEWFQQEPGSQFIYQHLPIVIGVALWSRSGKESNLVPV